MSFQPHAFENYDYFDDPDDFNRYPINLSNRRPIINIFIIKPPFEAPPPPNFQYYQQPIPSAVQNPYFSFPPNQPQMMPIPGSNYNFGQLPIQNPVQEKQDKHKKKDKKDKKEKKKDKKKDSKKSKKDGKKGEILTFEHKEGTEFDGIFRYLTGKTGGNISENGTITIKSSTVHSDYRTTYIPQNVVDFTSTDKYFYADTNDTYFWVSFDFNDMEVELSSYTIKSNHWSTNIGHIKTWVIEYSNDGSSWTVVDHRDNDASLNGTFMVNTFNVQEKKKFARYYRFRNTGKYWGGSGAGFNTIEFYGRIRVPKNKFK